MKAAVVIINVGNLNFSDLAIRANQKYYDHFGIELRFVTEHHSETKNTSPVWIKSLIYEVCPDLDFVLMQDLDILPIDLKYNVFDFLMFDQLNFATDCTRIGHKISDCDFPFFRWNAGLCGYPKKYQKFFRSIFDYGIENPNTCGFDQYYINEFIGKNELYVNEIPIRFNRFFDYNMDYSKHSFCHYTNSIPSKQKRETILKYHPEVMIKTNQETAH